jgi:hypothetical protein
VSEEGTGIPAPPKKQGEKPRNNLAAWLAFAGAVATVIGGIWVAYINNNGKEVDRHSSPSVPQTSPSVFVQPSQSVAQTSTSAPQIAQQLEPINSQWDEAFNKHDVAAVAAFFTANATLVHCYIDC